ncbi:MAG: bifunctional folylpolyglutamate synthase/dihydrofolate synthase [Planctomycetota bacterium]|nr:bifunctional folylpolyglutamate synthase/dihydrofolate synthase [Planctomycetota bacterium]
MVSATRSKIAKPKDSILAGKKKPVRGYEAALRYLYQHTDYEKMLRARYNADTFNLDRMNVLLKHLGEPHKKIRTVHIAGTKGKGSTAIMLAQMLKACGHKVGLYTSPHITDIRERILVNGEKITQAALTRLIAKVEPMLNKMADQKPTFFEIFTALAFYHFAQEKVDIAVIEAGLGGRLDSTNVLLPDVCGVTSISMDHMHQLGDTLGKIAAEKAGIFKRDVTVVSVPQTPEAKRVLRKVAREGNVPLLFTGEDIEFSYRVESSRREGCHTRICLTTPRSRFEHLPVPLMGEHQALNCGLALALLDQLKAKGMAIDDSDAMRGLADVYAPGRMEILLDTPKLLVDGAHNAASVQALMRAMGQHIAYDSLVLVFGCAADKDIPGMMRQIATGADKVIFTRAKDNARAARPEDLAEIYEEFSGRTPQMAQTLDEAIRIALNAVSREDLICVTGSFYLVGEAKNWFATSRPTLEKL